MKTRFKDQKSIRRQREGLQVIPTIQKILTVACITVGIMSMTSIPMEAKSNVAGAKRITEKKIFSCKTPQNNTQTTTLHLILEKLALPKDFEDPGGEYEIKTKVNFSVYPDGKSKNSICEGIADWGEKSYRKNEIKLAWSNFHLDLELIIKNIPLNGRVTFWVDMHEIDDFQDDYISFLRNDLSGDFIVAYPSKNIAYILAYGPAGKQLINERHDSEHLIRFGKRKRVVGTRTFSTGTVGKLDFTISSSNIQAKKVGGAVRHDKVGFCRKYALTAVDLNHKAQKFHCRGLSFMPLVWSNDHQGHYNWCIKDHNDNFALKENNKRKNQLNKCINKTADDYCHNYAQSAVDQFQHSQKPGCTVSGLGWSADKNAHFQWCVNTFKAGNISTIAAEKAQRETMLSNCK